MSAPPGTGRFLAITTVIALALATCVAVVARPYLDGFTEPRRIVPLSAAAPASTPVSGTAMQFVAHQDDDLYFMNPDIERTIRAGGASVTVFLTAGEANGRNGPKAPRDVEGYAAARNNGSRAAYAYMATGDRAARWERQSVRLRGGAVAELDTLVAAPHVRLVFLDTRKAVKEGEGVRLRTLWSGAHERLPTLVPTGSRAGGPYSYTRQDLIGSLADLMEVFRPTVVRTLDPDPDLQRHDAAHPAHSDSGGRSDHQDHTAAALFTWEAMRAYSQRAGDGPHAAVQTYRGYYNERWPHNLGPVALAEKKAVIDVYGWADRVDFCRDPAGCGDLKVGDRSLESGWPQSTTDRYPAGDPWLERGPDGRLHAWAVTGGAVARWSQKAAGGDDWTGPELFPGPGDGLLGPTLGLTRDATGRMHVFATRVTPSGGAGDRYRDIVTAVEDRPGGALGAWSSLGSPGRPRDQRGVGVPVAQTDGHGRVLLFARNAAKGLSGRVFADGRWSGWRDLGGAEISEGVTAVTGRDGSVSVFATGRGAIHRWTQGADGVVRRSPAVPAQDPTGPPAAVVDDDGATLLTYRQALTGRLLSLRRTGEGDFTPVTGVRHEGGTGGFTLTAVDKGAVLLAGNDDGRLSARPAGTADTAVPAGPLAVPPPGPHVGSPAAAVDARGRLVVAVIGVDARLHVRAGPARDSTVPAASPPHSRRTATVR